MKRIISLLLAMLMLISLAGCADDDRPAPDKPVSFYYLNDLSQTDDFNNIFVAEMREGITFQAEPLGLLNTYLKGPTTDTLTNPFPANLQVLSLEQSGEVTKVILSSQLTKLSDPELTLAGSCLSMTLFELVPCSSVEIAVEDKTLRGQKSLIFSIDSILTEDLPHLPDEKLHENS